MRHLRAFVALAEELHFGRAAGRLYLTQSAMSQTLKQLEGETGLRLVERTTRKVLLTPEGRAFHEEALRVLEAFDGLMERAHETAAGRRGHLRVGFTIGAAVDLVPEVRRAYRDAYPDVEVILREFDFSEPAAGLDDGSSDVAILRPPVDVDGVELRSLTSEPRVACLPVSHRLADREEVSVYEILDDPIIGAPGAGAWRDYWLVCDYRDGVPPPVVAEAATFESELQAVASGLGISITAEAAARFYARPGLRFPRISDIAPCDVAVALPASPTATARIFADVAVATTVGSAEERAATALAAHRRP